MGATVSRRSILRSMGATGAAIATIKLVPFGRQTGSAAAAAMGEPAPDLPGNIEPYVATYKNWAEAIVVDNVWTCDVAGPDDVVQLCNWAHQNGWRIRPRGHMHNWSPLTIDPDSTERPKILMVNTLSGLGNITVTPGSPASATVGTGADLEDFLNVLADNNLGVANHPAPGDLTMGGVLAVATHGTSLPAIDETTPEGYSFGSMSNLITSLTAVVWDDDQDQYVLQTFSRSDADIGPLLCHLGRAFVTEVTLRVGPLQYVHCRSYTDIPMAELCAPQGSTDETAEKLLDQSGRLEIICFPFTDKPWTKVWTVRDTRPFLAKPVNGPYNYPFSDQVPQVFTDLLSYINRGHPEATPALGRIQLTSARAGLVTSLSSSLYGKSKDTFLYIRPTTLRINANGYAVLCKRDDIQRVLNDFWAKYSGMLAEYQGRNSFPMNGPVEIRVLGLDNAADCGVPEASPPWLSPTRPAPDHPEWNCAVYFDVLTIPGTSGAEEFYRELEQWIFSHYTGDYARVRVEWSKGWAYSDTAAWVDEAIITDTVPASLTDGQPAGSTFNDAVAILNRYDPHRIFSSPFLDQLMPANP